METNSIATIVSDTGPLITFARAGLTSLLREVARELIIPEAVEAELNQPGRPGAELIGQPWLHKFTVPPNQDYGKFPTELGDGEREAIIAAQIMGALLLVDDSSARREAERRGLSCLSTLRLLTQAKRDGLVDQVEPILRQLRGKGGFWISKVLYRSFLDGLKES